MRYLWVLIAFIVGVVIDKVFGIALFDLVKPVFKLLSIQWWIIIVLVSIVIFLLLLIDGARRYHKRIVGELVTCGKNSESLAKAYGKLHHCYDMLYRDDLEPLPRALFGVLDHDVRLYLQEYFKNSQKVKDFCADLPRIDLPHSLDSLDKQKNWVYAFMQKLEKLLAEQHEELSTALKITESG